MNDECLGIEATRFASRDTKCVRGGREVRRVRSRGDSFAVMAECEAGTLGRRLGDERDIYRDHFLLAAPQVGDQPWPPA